MFKGGDIILEYNLVYLKKEGPLATIYLNRPNKRNAISWAMWISLGEILKEVQDDDNVRALIIRSTDTKSFSAGADIGEFNSIRASSELAKKYNRKAYEVETLLANLNKPTMAMISGYCIGAGCELSSVCDFRFADTTSIFAITPAKIGMVYNLFGVKYLVNQIGLSHAKDMLFSARKVSAEEAFHMNLIDRFYEPEKLESEVYEYMERLSRNSSVSIRGIKRIFQEVIDYRTEESPEIEQIILNSFDSDDYKEGILAFLNKRNPNF